MRLAIAVCTKQPTHFDTWLRHHRMVGIEHFFIRVEDSPDVSDMLSKCPDVTLSSEGSDVNQYGVESRQCSNATYAMSESQSMGITHVLHLDDDELIVFPKGFDAFCDHARRVTTENIHISNYEVCAPHIDVVNPFVECHAVRRDPHTFRGYGWGKCIGVVGRTTESISPHTFHGYFTEVSPDIAVIYHYESIPYTKWLQKTKRYADVNLTSNYSFVNESVKLIRSEPSEEVLKEFWCQRCVA